MLFSSKVSNYVFRVGLGSTEIHITDFSGRRLGVVRKRFAVRGIQLEVVSDTEHTLLINIRLGGRSCFFRARCPARNITGNLSLADGTITGKISEEGILFRAVGNLDAGRLRVYDNRTTAGVLAKINHKPSGRWICSVLEGSVDRKALISFLSMLVYISNHIEDQNLRNDVHGDWAGLNTNSKN